MLRLDPFMTCVPKRDHMFGNYWDMLPRADLHERWFAMKSQAVVCFNFSSHKITCFIFLKGLTTSEGKVIETIEKGYYLNDKIIRYAKVVVGE